MFYSPTRYGTCTKCGNFVRFDTHICGRLWEVDVIESDYQKIVYAMDKEEAAEKVIDRMDGEESCGWANDNRCIDVRVRQVGNEDGEPVDGEAGEWESFHVSCDLVSTYSCNKK